MSIFEQKRLIVFLRQEKKLFSVCGIEFTCFYHSIIDNAKVKLSKVPAFIEDVKKLKELKKLSFSGEYIFPLTRCQFLTGTLQTLCNLNW